MDKTKLLLNVVWTMLGAILVYFMQAGFIMVETGFTRAKNAGTVAFSMVVVLSLLENSLQVLQRSVHTL